MKRLVYASCILLTTACHRRSDDKLAEVSARLDKIEKRLDQVERRAGGAPRRPGPDPNTVYWVPIHDEDPVHGAAHAKVTIVEGFDFACPYCAASRPAVEEVLARHGNDVRVVSRQYVVHPDVATTPALGVCAARKQGKQLEFEQAVWDAAWKVDNGKPTAFDKEKLAQASLESIAKDLGLDVERFKADLAAPDCKASLERDARELTAVGTNGTPAFYINGRPYQGARTAEAFEAAIAEEIKKADASGVGTEEYYPSLMKNAKKAL